MLICLQIITKESLSKASNKETDLYLKRRELIQAEEFSQCLKDFSTLYLSSENFH